MNRPDISKLGKNRSVFLKLGLIMSLSFVIFAFNWTSYERPALVELDPEPHQDDFTEIIPRTIEKKQLPPPPVVETTTIIEDIEEPEFIEEPKPVLVDPQIVSNEEPKKDIELPPVPVVVEDPVPPAPILEDPKEEEPEFFKVVEEMPRFNSCEAETNKDVRKKCAERALLKHINSKIKYPRMALENSIEGNVVVRFIVDEKGAITNAEIIRDIGGGCGKEALRVIKEMPNWIPGKQRGKPVKVQYNLPIKFTTL